MKKGRPSRPILPDGALLTDEIWSILIWSWIHDPNSRPSVKAVIQTLESALEKLPFDVDVSPPLDDMESPVNVVSTIPMVLTLATDDVASHGVYCSRCRMVRVWLVFILSPLTSSAYVDHSGRSIPVRVMSLRPVIIRIQLGESIGPSSLVLIGFTTL